MNRNLKLIAGLVFIFTTLPACGRSNQIKKDTASCWGSLDNYPYSAIDNCSKAIESGQLSGNQLAQAYFDRGQAYRSKMDNERAIHDFTEAINLNPKLAAAFLNRGYLYYAIKFDSDRALDDLNEAVRLNPEDAEAFDLRAVIYASKNDYENAKKSVGEAKRVNPILMGVKQEVCGGEEFCDAFLREGKKQSFSNYEIYFYAVGGTGYGTVGAVLKKDGKQRSVLKVFKGLGANGEVLEINTKVLDGQNYLEVYEATSKGNGTIELYRLDGSTVLLVFDARGVDQHDDGSMFEGGLLRASYPDINQDGHFDVVLEGTVVSGGDSPDRSLVKQQCRRVFLWNPKTALFQESAGGAINPKLCGEAK